MATGKLAVTAKGGIQLKYTTARGNEATCNIAQNQLAAALAAVQPANLAGLEVEFDVAKNGQPEKVRPVGQAWAAPAPPAPPPRPGGGRSQPPFAERRDDPPRAPTTRQGEFHNPYNFVPAPPRTGNLGELGDTAPVSHDRFHAHRYTGTLTVRLTAETPLLVPDAARVTVEPGGDAKGHKTFPIRLGPDGLPLLAPTAVKGMLRAAYEAVTNSRFGVFAGHDDRLAYRMPARDGLRLIPARIETTPAGPQAVLLPGDSGITPSGKPDGPMYAAWLQMYGQFQRRWPVMPRHGMAVWAYLTLWDHTNFLFWNVADLEDGAKPLPTYVPTDPRRPWRKARPTGEPGFWQRGFVCLTYQNIDNKHDERVFFTTRPQPPVVPLEPRVADGWGELVRNYQQEHADEIARGVSRPSALNNRECVWSRHVTGGDAEWQLRDGTLCYAQIGEKPGGGLEVVALYPVMIARKLFPAAPAELLRETHLQPAASLDELSPADRVFGWVHAKGQGAYRGNVRLGPVRCLAANAAEAVETFPAPGVPLAILGQPKPQQARFYVAASPRGEKQGDRQLSKEAAGYSPGKGLRGRKVYPHHRGLPDGYWRDPAADRTQKEVDGRFQEYRRPVDKDNDRDDQNRSVLGWVKPGAAFAFELHATNLSAVELGALLWLLQLPPGRFHRFGGGKPLGFGSVRLELTDHDLRTGEQVAEMYRTLGDSVAGSVDVATLVEEFGQAVQTAYPDGRFRDAFLRAAEGFKLPIHYPRARQDGQTGSVPPHPEGKAFEWFVENERDPDGDRLALPDLIADAGLPLHRPRPRR